MTGFPVRTRKAKHMYTSWEPPSQQPTSFVLIANKFEFGSYLARHAKCDGPQPGTEASDGLVQPTRSKRLMRAGSRSTLRLVAPMTTARLPWASKPSISLQPCTCWADQERCLPILRTFVIAALSSQRCESAGRPDTVAHIFPGDLEQVGPSTSRDTSLIWSTHLSSTLSSRLDASCMSPLSLLPPSASSSSMKMMAPAAAPQQTSKSRP